MRLQYPTIKSSLIFAQGDQYKTIEAMKQTARKFAHDNYTLDFIHTYNITPTKAGIKKAAHILFLNTRFLSDPIEVQYIRTLKASLISGISNCVDYSTALASICIALNVPCAFVMASTDPNNQDAFNHVYIVVFYNIPIDLVLGQSQDGSELYKKNSDRVFFYGQEYDSLFNKKFYPINYKL